MKHLLLGIVFLFSFSLAAGCIVHTVEPPPPERKIKRHKQGPPPHAPAHGYRHRHHHGVDMEYDSGIGAYAVINMPGTYFYNGLYMHQSAKRNWLVAPHFKGPWRDPRAGEIPPKLRHWKGQPGKKNYKKW